MGNPVMPHLLACYSILEADESGYRVIQRQVPYDKEAVKTAIRAKRHPAADFLSAFMDGTFVADHTRPDNLDERIWQRG